MAAPSIFKCHMGESPSTSELYTRTPKKQNKFEVWKKTHEQTLDRYKEKRFVKIIHDCDAEEPSGQRLLTALKSRFESRFASENQGQEKINN